jgi:hypothetical protein
VEPDDFWNSTLRHTLLQVEGFIYRQQIDNERQVSSAWLMAAWQRSKKMPSLRSVLSRSKRRKDKPIDKQQTKAELDQMIADMTGDLALKPKEKDG